MKLALLLCLLLTLSEPVAQRRARPTPTATPTPDLTSTETAGMTLLAVIFFTVASIIFLLFYFLPSILAWRKVDFIAIFALNFLVGWTFIGWVVSLVWALKSERPVR